MASCIAILGLLAPGCGPIDFDIPTSVSYDLTLSFNGNSSFCFGSGNQNFDISIVVTDANGGAILNTVQTIDNTFSQQTLDINLPTTGMVNLIVTATGDGCFQCCSPFSCTPNENQPQMTNSVAIDLATSGPFISLILDDLQCECC